MKIESLPKELSIVMQDDRGRTSSGLSPVFMNDLSRRKRNGNFQRSWCCDRDTYDG